MKLRVLLDARKLGDGGIGTYIENLVRGLCNLQSEREIDCQLTLLVTGEHAAARRKAATAAAEATATSSNAPSSNDPLLNGEVLIVEEPSAKYSLSEYLLLARRHRKLLDSHDIYHAPHYTLPFFLGRPSVVTIHDVIHVTHPETPMHRPAGRALIGSAIRRASHVITVSEASRAEIERLLPARNRPPISVIPNALKEVFRRQRAEARAGAGSDEELTPYCLFVGNAKPHKGWRTLLTAWQLLWNDPVAACPHLVLVGQLVGDEVESAIRQCGLQGVVSVVRKVSDEELRGLYQGAQAVVVPSLVEGFALPALEALACGAPLVTTPLPAVREVCGDVPWYAEGFTARAIADAVTRCLREAPSASVRRQAGRSRAEWFDINQVARATWEVYLAAARASGGRIAEEIRRMEEEVRRRDDAETENDGAGLDEPALSAELEELRMAALAEEAAVTAEDRTLPDAEPAADGKPAERRAQGG